MGVWIAKIFRALFLLLDRVAYWAVTMVYELFMMLSETGVFTQDTIQKFAGRIYVLLGVFMLFKVSFSLITYILNPDDFSDKGKGINKLLMNFFVVLIGIVTIPYIFQAAFQLQSIVLKDNIIGNIILGNVTDEAGNSNNAAATNYIEEGGKRMAFTALSAFIRLNPDLVGDECSNKPVVCNDTDCEINSSCLNYGDGGASVEALLKTTTGSGYTVEETLITAYSENNIYELLDSDVANLRVQDNNGIDYWLFDYNFLISTIAGGFLAWILLLFCFDVATRSVKLGFLQLIAPVPIISYVDPKSGKDGMFKKWVNECTSTYISLFGRLVAIYFAVFVISEIINGRIYSITTGKTQTNVFVIVFIIFGALMFAKQLPDLISNITGIKLGGGFTLNPMKKLGEAPLIGGAIGAGMTLAGGGAAMLGRAATMPARGVANGLRSAARGRGFGLGWSESANKTKNDLQRRWHHSSMEAQGRASSMFSSKGYQGETAHQMYKKEKDEKAKNAIQARYDYRTRRNDWDYGSASNSHQASLGVNPAEYRKAGFKSEEFINSMIAIEKSKERLRTAEVAYIQAQQDFEAGIGSADIVEAAKSNYTKQQSALDSAKENHEKFMVPRHAEDAALEKDRKYAKGFKPGE